jgi:histidinol-phosphate aminotransferase
MFDPKALLRPHLKDLVPYSSARDDYKGSEGVFLDANENPIGSITKEDWNRYPDPYQVVLKQKIAELKMVEWQQLFLGNGSDEPIDLLFRAFCEPDKDNVIINPPTYGMYQVSADINGVEAKQVLLTNTFDLDVEGIKTAIDDHTKIIFICSPNNPTGNDVATSKIKEVLSLFRGIVVVDEAYIDFADRDSWISSLAEFPNLVVLQTFSKAWGLAALRLGMAFASERMIGILNMIKPPYNISGLVQETVLTALSNHSQKDDMVHEILTERTRLRNALERLELIEKVYPTDANFFLVKMARDAKKVYQDLIDQKVIVRDRSSVVLCDQGLRITVGTVQENDKLLNTLKGLA